MAKQTNKTGYAKVLKVVTKAKLAKMLGKSRQAIGNWGEEVPEAYALRVGILTDIPPEEIIPETVAEIRRQKETT